MKIIEITSRDNEKLKFARRIRDGDEPGYMFVEGSRLCGECVRSNVDIEFCVVSREFTETASFERLGTSIHEKDITLLSVSEKLLESVAETKSPQGVIFAARKPKVFSIANLFEDLDERLPIIVYLYRINNPSNLGAVIRTAEAAGGAGVIVSANSADPFSPKSLRASMGSAFRLPILSNTKIEEVIETAKRKNVEVVAVDAGGGRWHTDHDWQKKTMLVFGSEADGLPGDVIAASDTKLSIEMNSEVESLNLAVSCGIVLFEAKRHKHPSAADRPSC